ncbi:uncharacterized protein NPIL_249901 [Nephila pilipes]|uniref:Mutator-like transposase domain-containing protein n=1 Tax=Nephila pilipes TaxID=299642 RepID=A0A8X6QEJ1_NEPPI|nr:uncharacterized protein NPIL_249901 [Nephila pilipes]
MRCIGKGNSPAKTFCAIMNLPPPPAKFERYNDVLSRSLLKVSSESMKNAVEETVNINSNRDITEAFDGSWQKSSHTSLNGIEYATFLETGKVFDFECLSNSASNVKIEALKTTFLKVSVQWGNGIGWYFKNIPTF